MAKRDGLTIKTHHSWKYWQAWLSGADIGTAFGKTKREAVANLRAELAKAEGSAVMSDSAARRAKVVRKGGVLSGGEGYRGSGK